MYDGAFAPFALALHSYRLLLSLTTCHPSRRVTVLVLQNTLLFLCVHLSAFLFFERNDEKMKPKRKTKEHNGNKNETNDKCNIV